MIRHSLLLSLCGALAVSAAQPAAPFPAPKNLGDPATLGLNIQRTMTLLATSTPVQRNTVRVLFYGQSITEQEWTKEVTADLRRRFPNANLLIENRAIGGHSSQLLVKTAEADLYPFQPDLMIFYVYGSHTDYESIIRRTRERTTAEILMQTDHATKDSDLTEPTDPAKVSPAQWNSFMNYKFLPRDRAQVWLRARGSAQPLEAIPQGNRPLRHEPPQGRRPPQRPRQLSYGRDG